MFAIGRLEAKEWIRGRFNLIGWIKESVGGAKTRSTFQI